LKFCGHGIASQAWMYNKPCTHEKASETAQNSSNFVENKFYLAPFIHFFKKECTLTQFAFPSACLDLLT